MGFRFRKSFKIAPGVRINISKSGIGGSVGGKGFSHSVGPGGQRTNVGLPGTGLGFSHRHGKKAATEEIEAPPASLPAPEASSLSPIRIVIFISIVAVIVYMLAR